MAFRIPQVVKDNLSWASMVGIGFLVIFYVDNTYMTREAWAEQESQLLKQLTMISVQISKQAEIDKRNLKIDGLQDSIADSEDEIMELTIYIEEAPDSNLTQARQRRVRELEIEISRLVRQLDQINLEER